MERPVKLENMRMMWGGAKIDSIAFKITKQNDSALPQNQSLSKLNDGPVNK